ncbi:MAG: DUF481 domain-containing protein [Saprospirales bacterium]|nr:DUF481 domain-containing protein [Saprospirales bacterium]
MMHTARIEMRQRRAAVLIQLIIALAACNPHVFGQINESDTLRLQYRTALTGNLQSGNLEALTLIGRLDLSVAPSRRWALKTQNAARYQAFYGRKADNDFLSQNFVYAGQQHTFYPFVMAFLLGNFRRKINFRWIAGPGVTWQVLRRPGQVMKLSAAAVYESTDFAGQTFNYPVYDGSGHIGTWRATFRLFGQHRLLQQRLLLFYEAYVQPSVEQSENFRWLADGGVELPLWKGLSFTTHFTYTHENVVIRPVKSGDMILSFGFSFRK